MREDLFENAALDRLRREAPLARRIAPRTLDELIGQDHILGPGTVLRRAIEADRVTSLILYGPPGSGKTALASIIAMRTRAHFEPLNAVTSGVNSLRWQSNAAFMRTGAPSYLWTRFTASTAPNRTRCCPTWRTATSS